MIWRAWSFFVFCLCAAFFNACSAYAGAWLMPYKKHQLFTTVRNHISTNYYDGAYRKKDGCTERRSDIEGYWEYGLSPYITIGSKQLAQHATKNRTLKNPDAPCDRKNSAVDKKSALAWREQRYFFRVPLYQGRANRIISIQPELFLPGIHPSGHETLFGDESYGWAVRLAFGKQMRTRIIRKPFNRLPAIRWIPKVTWQRFVNYEYTLEQDIGADIIRGHIEHTYGFTNKPWFFWTKLRATKTLSIESQVNNPQSGDYDYSGYSFTTGRELSDGTALMVSFIDDIWARNYNTGYGLEFSIRRNF